LGQEACPKWLKARTKRKAAFGIKARR